MAELNKACEVAKNEVETKLGAYVSAYNGGEMSKKDVKKLGDSMKDAVKAYNKALEKAVYEDWAKQGDPIKTALRARWIPNAMKVSCKENDDGVMIATIQLKSDFLAVDLPRMQATIGEKAFSNPKWFAKAEKLCFIVANRVSHDIGKGTILGDISDDAKAFDFGKDDPLSDAGIIKALQQTIDSILYIPNGKKNLIEVDANKDEGDKRTYSHMWTYIRESMTRKASVGMIEVCNTGSFTHLLADVMHLALTNGNLGLSVEGKKD